MTKRDKVVMLSSVLLAACVIASGVVFSIYSNKNSGSMNIGSMVYVGVIILIGIFSVAVVYFTKVRKGKYERILDTSYFQEYEIIRDSIMNSQLPNYRKKEIIEDILDMLLSAQKAGKTVGDVIGNPVEFSRKISSAFFSPARAAILSIFDGIITFILFIIGVNTLLWLEQIDRSYFSTRIEISMLLFFVIISFGLIPATKKLTSTKNIWMFLMPITCGIVYILAAEILRKYFYNIDAVKILLDGTLRMVPNITVFMVYFLSIPVLAHLKNYIRKQAIRR